jgi:hypothetical protein
MCSSYLELCWWYKCVDNDRQQTPPSLPFVHPWAKAMMLVVDQELLLCQLHFKYARFYNKVFYRNLNELAFYLPVIPCYLLSFLAFSKSQVVARQNRWTDLLIVRSLIDYLFGGFDSFAKQIVVPQMIHSISQFVCIPHQWLLIFPFFYPTI